MKKERIIYLDLVRILSFLMVTAYHFAVAVPACGVIAEVEYYIAYRKVVWSLIAVAAFFMVSGGALIHRYREQFSLKEYYKKRFFGIYPLFWLAYLIVFLEFFYRVGSMPTAPKVNFLLSVVGIDGYLNGTLPTFYMVGEWFLGALIVMYILFPLYRIVMLKCRYVLPVVFFAIGLYIYYNDPFHMPIKKDLFVCSMYFTLGMLIEMIREDLSGEKRVIVQRCAALAGVIVFALVCAVDAIEYPYSVVLMTLSFYLVVMEISQWITGSRAGQVITVIGRHSYAYFLLHHFFLYRYITHFCGHIMSTGNVLLLFVSSIAHIYLLAVLLDKLYSYISRSLRKWKDGAV